MAEEPEPKEPDNKEPETEKAPKRPPKSTAKEPTTVTKPDEPGNIDLGELKERLVFEITPAGWIIIIGTLVLGVAAYSWYKQRKAQGKGMLPDQVQERFRAVEGGQ